MISEVYFAKTLSTSIYYNGNGTPEEKRPRPMSDLHFECTAIIETGNCIDVTKCLNSLQGIPIGTNGGEHCKNNLACCQLNEDLPIGAPCLTTEGVGVCTTEGRCNGGTLQGNCQSCAVCCISLPEIGQECSIDVNTHSFCIPAGMCNDAVDNLSPSTCSPALTVCCEMLPVIGQDCDTGGICVIRSDCKDDAIHEGCDGPNTVCCPSSQIPANDDSCQPSETQVGQCLDRDYCRDNLGGSLFPVDICQDSAICCKIPVVAEKVGDACFGVNASGICTNVLGCLDTSPMQRNCEDGAVCCLSLPSQPTELCSSSINSTGLCLSNDYCQGTVETVSVTCDGENVECCQSFPGMGEACSIDGVCAFKSQCKGAPQHKGCSDHGTICCSKDDLPGIGELCAINLMTYGTCTKTEYCIGDTTSPELCAGDGIACCTSLPDVGDICDDNGASCINAELCSAGGITDSPCHKDVSVCCKNEQMPGRFEKCYEDKDEIGLCFNSDDCIFLGGHLINSTLCSSGRSCCIANTFYFGETCIKEGGIEGICIPRNLCEDETPKIDTCMIGFDCCINKPDEPLQDCAYTETQSGKCVEYCKDGLGLDSTCSAPGTTCCADFPDIGEKCSASASCSYSKNCKSGSIVEDSMCDGGGVCCEMTGQPGKGEKCGLSSADEGLCVSMEECSGSVIEGYLCQTGYVCCDGGISEIGEQCIQKSGSGICTNPNHCHDDALNQGTCTDGGICCINLPSVEGDVCSLSLTAYGICSISCTDSSAVGTSCMGDDLECCPTSGVPNGPGSSCGRFGTCESQCSNGDIDETANSECRTGLFCCVEGLNKSCSLTLLHGGRDRKCIYPEDCTKSTSFLLLRRKCKNKNLICC